MIQPAHSLADAKTGINEALANTLIELNSYFLSQLISSVDDGFADTLYKHFGLEAELEKVFGLQLHKVTQHQLIQLVRSLSRLEEPPIKISIDMDIVQQELSAIRDRDHIHTLVLSLIEADAPRPMLASLFKISQRQYSAIRQTINLQSNNPNGGRPKNPTEEEEEFILNAWDKLDGEQQIDITNQIELAERCLAIYRLLKEQETPVTMGVLWSVLVSFKLKPNENVSILKEKPNALGQHPTY